MIDSALRVAKGTGLLLLVGLLSWRIIVSGMAEYYSQQDDRAEAVEALFWQSQQPQGLYQQALTQIESDPPAAERLLQAAAWADPSDALVYLALADLWVKAGRVPAAQGLVAVADALGPMRPPALSRSADFWLRQGQWDRVLARWSNLLLNRPEIGRARSLLGWAPTVSLEEGLGRTIGYFRETLQIGRPEDAPPGGREAEGLHPREQIAIRRDRRVA